MINNEILRQIRYTLDLSDSEMISIFGLADCKITRKEVCDWLKKEEDPSYELCNDVILESFLNGLIYEKRGKKDDGAPKVLGLLTNNAIFMKLKIAFNLKAEEVLEIIALADFRISKHELSAFFRKESHKHYRGCKDQILRYFLKGLQLKFRKNAS